MKGVKSNKKVLVLCVNVIFRKRPLVLRNAMALSDLFSSRR